ncbi:hypothetical protein PLEOSDRAFT_1105709 [Pleurotus ostreatus PC15]|uniref:Uncharacterized protein n=1 Tax=Pleurotus ostreatus (strain PC15) TaxID=1137138 RepID=A0A067NIM9_PLEO1|nr:hypothetical protein PLEOSDRAFT_1105709 [Pleurotus ostreatus PC15]
MSSLAQSGQPHHIVKYSGRLNQENRREPLQPPTSSLPPVALRGGNEYNDAPLQSSEDMRRRMLKRSRTDLSAYGSEQSIVPYRDIEVELVDNETSAYMQSSLETPLPTAHRLSETYKLPSGIGKDVPPQDFSPLPRATYSRRKMGENRAPTDQAINRWSSLRGINSKHSKKNDEERLARTSSGNLKENASGDISNSSNKKGKSSALSTVYSQRASKEAKSRSGTRRSHRQAKHSASSRSSSPGSRVQPLSSPFTSRPSSAASSPRSATDHISSNAVTANIVGGNVRPVKSKSGQFKVPFLPNTRSNQYGVHSTATSPAHSTICAHSPTHDVQDHVNNVVKARRPSAPSATRPSSEHIFSAFPYAAQEPEDDSITLANRGILGLTFDRPPSQLDYTHVYWDSEGQYLGGCDLDGVDEDLFSESLSTLLIPNQPSWPEPNASSSEFSMFWSEVRGMSTPFDRSKHADDRENCDFPYHDDDDEQGEGILSGIFPFASAPGARTPELQQTQPSAHSVTRPYLRSCFSDTVVNGGPENVEESPTKEFVSPRSGRTYYCSPKLKEKRGHSTSDGWREGKGLISGEGGSELSWQSDSLISPPTAIVKKFQQGQVYARSPLNHKDTKDKGGHDRNDTEDDDGTMDMELDACLTAPTINKPSKHTSIRIDGARSLDDIFGSVNISIEEGSLDLDKTIMDGHEPSGVHVIGTDDDATRQSNGQLSAPVQPVKSVASSATMKGRNRRGTIKASDFPQPPTAGAENDGTNAMSRRTRSGTITARNLGLGHNTGSLGSSNTSAPRVGVEARRTRSGTIIAPPATKPINHRISNAKDGTNIDSRSNAQGRNPAGNRISSSSSAVNVELSQRTEMNAHSPNSTATVSSPDPINLLGPPINIQNEVWQVAPRVFSPENRRSSVAKTSLRPCVSDAPRLRVMQPLKGGPRGGARGMGPFAMMLSTMKRVDENERSSDDELLLKGKASATRK